VLEDSLTQNLVFNSDVLQTFHRLVDSQRIKIQNKGFQLGRELFITPIQIANPKQVTA